MYTHRRRSTWRRQYSTYYVLCTPLTTTTDYVLCTLTVAGGHGGGDDRDEDPATDEAVHGEVAVGEGAC